MGALGPIRGEVMPAVHIEIRPESPISGTWRVYHVTDRPQGRQPLSRRGSVLGGTMRQAYEAAEMLERTHQFVFDRPLGGPVAR